MVLSSSSEQKHKNREWDRRDVNTRPGETRIGGVVSRPVVQRPVVQGPVVSEVWHEVLERASRRDRSR